MASTLYVQFISDNQEYSAYCITNDKFIKFFRFDENLNIKDMDSDNNECYSISAIDSAKCYSPFSSHLIYFNNDNKYYLVTTCSDEDNIDYVLKLTNNESCNTRIETSGFNVISEPVSEGEKTTATNAAPVPVESTEYSPIFSTPFSKEIDVSASFDVDFSSPLNNDNEIIINTNDLMMKDCPNMSKNKECIEECPPLDFFSKKCFLNSNDPILIDKMLEKINENILNGSLEQLLSSIIEAKEEYIITYSNNIIFTLSTIDNKNYSNKYNNISLIDFGECGEKLKAIYSNKTLIIFKTDIFEEGLLIPIVEYEIYDPIDKKK